MKVWAVANQKGGVGKTTSTVALAGLLADAGRRVLVVDLDPHGSLTSYFGYDPDTIEYSCYDLFTNDGQVEQGLPERIKVPTNHPNIDLLPSSTAVAVLERQSLGRGGLGLVLSRALSQLWDQYDFALLDNPPLLGVLMVNALAASERLVIPVQTEFLAIKGLERMVNTIEMVNHSRAQPLPYTIVPTMFDRRTQASLGTLRVLRDKFEPHLWPAYIPIDTKLRDASQKGLVPSVHDKNSRAVVAYRALLKYLLSQTLNSGREPEGKKLV